MQLAISSQWCAFPEKKFGSDLLKGQNCFWYWLTKGRHKTLIFFPFPTKYQTKHPKESWWASSNSVPFVLLSNLSKYQKLKNMCTRVLLNTLLVYGRNNHWFFCGILYLTCYPALRCLNLKLNLCSATHFSYILHHLFSFWWEAKGKRLHIMI